MTSGAEPVVTGPLVAGAGLLGLWSPAGAGSPATVTGGAGGAAALVADVDVLGQALDAARHEADGIGTLADLAGGALGVQGLAFWAPGECAQAGSRCVTASARVAAALARLEAITRATHLAAEAYAGTEEAVTRTWHLATAATVPGSLVVLVLSGALHEGLGARGLGSVEALAAQATADGLPAALGVDTVFGAQLLGAAAQATGRPGTDDVVADSALRRATAGAALAYGATGHRTTPIDLPSPPATGPGLEGLVQGVGEASAAGGLVAVRERTVPGPHGEQKVRIIDLPGTDEWLPGSKSPRDLGSSLAQLGGLRDDAYVEAVLELVGQAPPGEKVVIVGHSLGGVTASTVAAVAASRGRTVDYVVTAGAPVDTMRVPRGTTVVSVQNAADVVPSADGMPARDVAGRTTVTVTDDRGSATANHAVGTYVCAARSADALARRDAGLAMTYEQMIRDGALVAPGSAAPAEHVRWYRIERPP